MTNNLHMTQQQGPVAMILGGPQTKIGQGARQSTDMIIASMILKLK
jgi:hypothetical protein